MPDAQDPWELPTPVSKGQTPCEKSVPSSQPLPAPVLPSQPNGEPGEPVPPSQPNPTTPVGEPVPPSQPGEPVPPSQPNPTTPAEPVPQSETNPAAPDDHEVLPPWSLPAEELSDGAIYKRMYRVFQRSTDGSYKVSTDWLKAWQDKSSEEGRERLKALFEKCNYQTDRVCTEAYLLVCVASLGSLCVFYITPDRTNLWLNAARSRRK